LGCPRFSSSPTRAVTLLGTNSALINRSAPSSPWTSPLARRPCTFLARFAPNSHSSLSHPVFLWATAVTARSAGSPLFTSCSLFPVPPSGCPPPPTEESLLAQLNQYIADFFFGPRPRRRPESCFPEGSEGFSFWSMWFSHLGIPFFDLEFHAIPVWQADTAFF